MIVTPITLLSAVTATGASSAVDNKFDRMSFHAFGTTSAGAGSATIKVQGSNDGSNWADLDSLSLTLATTSSSDSYVTDARFRYIRGNVTAISGTDATVTLIMGV